MNFIGADTTTYWRVLVFDMYDLYSCWFSSLTLLTNRHMPVKWKEIIHDQKDHQINGLKVWELSVGTLLMLSLTWYRSYTPIMCYALTLYYSMVIHHSSDPLLKIILLIKNCYKGGILMWLQHTFREREDIGLINMPLKCKILQEKNHPNYIFSSVTLS